MHTPAQIAIALAALACLLPAAPAGAADGRDDPLVFVHGVDVLGDPGYSCDSQFGDMEKAFRGWGWQRSIYKVAYYEGDHDCNATINNDGSHSVHWGSGHYPSGGHGANTRIEHLGYHLAWDIYNRYTSQGYTIDMFGHSMGGLIIRYAIAQTQANHPDFPPELRVEDVVTAGTPHGGARGWGWACPYTQCDQMDAGSGFLLWLEENAWEPDGTGGTDWSSFGSDDDNYVAADRATGVNGSRTETRYFGSCHKIWYSTQANVEHDGFKTDVSTAIDHHVYKTNVGTCANPLVWDTTYYHPVRAADQALMLAER